jgi:hypothetical protein
MSELILGRAAARPHVRKLRTLPGFGMLHVAICLLVFGSLGVLNW